MFIINQRIHIWHKTRFPVDCPNGFDYVVVDANQMSASSVYTRDTGDPTLLRLHGPGNGRLYNVMNAGN